MVLPVPSVRKEHLTLVLEIAMLYLGSFHFCLLIHLRHCMYYYASFFFSFDCPSYKMDLWLSGRVLQGNYCIE